MTQKLETLNTEKYPLVMAAQYISGHTIPSISIDNVAATKAVMTHLIRLGHQKIAHITVSPMQVPYLDRLNTYLDVLNEYNIPIDEELICYGSPTIQGGYDQMLALLAREKTFTAVFAAGDTMAFGAMKALKNKGIRITEDCAVVGFDDIDFSAFCEPALTTIRQPKKIIGKLAFQKLFSLMKNESVAGGREILPYELITSFSI